MKKVLLVCALTFVFVSFTNVNNQKTILKDIDGTLLQSYAVIDNAEKTITFEVDANTTVSSALVDGEFKIYLLENGTSNKTKEYILTIEGEGNLSFDNYFESKVDVASLNGSIAYNMLKEKPKKIVQ